MTFLLLLILQFSALEARLLQWNEDKLIEIHAEFVAAHQEFIAAWVEYSEARQEIVLLLERRMQVLDLKEDPTELSKAMKRFQQATGKLKTTSKAVAKYAGEIHRHSKKLIQ